MFEYKRVLFMIEGGRALELVKNHVAEAKRVRARVRALALELGVEQIWTDRETGVLRSVRFPGKVHPDFTKPTKNGSHPKKGTEWAKRFDEQKGYECPSYVIADALGIPLEIRYGNTGGHGFRCIGLPFSACGFAYLGEAGPYVMWVPDVPAEVAASEKGGYTVAEPAKSFKLEFDGCRRIEDEEWDILVAQHNLAKKKATSAGTVA
ncbi:hypothetical protein X879_1953 [Burkholderia pseudomallei MSHR3951]|uniref:hypothetical protein n=1 Tax=Burkholderia pseudomallei TaxID=28450 RepID=UPI000537ADEE|nr:hypothetical protein [Burkholderia pseudomallei]KGV86540.1 hypothetical protein X879_1953 [Burkholderia pseudomallei MSHR3951]